MQINHIALWTNQLEQLRSFYMRYFEFESNQIYVNPNKAFASYFLESGNGVKLELMANTSHAMTAACEDKLRVGWAHLAISVGSQENVEMLTERLRNEGISVSSEPRRTGDGYYESCIEDPDGNLIEITL